MASSTSTSTGTTSASPKKISSSVNSAEIDETLARIRSHKGVEGILIMTKDGAIIQSSLSEEQSTTHGALLSQLTSKTSSIIKALDMNENNDGEGTTGGDDELAFLRIRSKKKEILISPDKDFIMVVIQNPNSGIGL